MFLDEVVISVKSGRGGRGCESYLRRTDRKMIPNGGDGGWGGDVILRSDCQTGSLVSLKSKTVFEAESGKHGSGNNRYGQNAKPLVIKVPCGTTVYDHTQKLLIRDLVESGEEVVVAKGGRGGYGNHSRRPVTSGEEGQSLELFLSLSIIADIFLVGLPNSGKTTLLKLLTHAHIEPADYPFATKMPCLGTYEGASGKTLRICELPAVYKHSAEGRGLGNSFLKHLKRAELIFIVIDPLNPFARDLKEGYDTLIQAIKDFDPALLDIKQFVIINKMDNADAKRKVRSKRIRFEDPVFQISALEGTGIKKLMQAALKILKSKS